MDNKELILEKAKAKKRAADIILYKVCNQGKDVNDFIINYNRGMAYVTDKEVLDTMTGFINVSECYRSAINHSTSLLEIANLAIMCIGGMTGDTVFTKMNLERINKFENEEKQVFQKESRHFKNDRRSVCKYEDYIST